MTRIFGVFVFVLSFSRFAFGQNLPSDLSFLSINPPATCNTADNKIVTSQELFGTGTGYACMRTFVFPQFAAGNGWTTQITGVYPLLQASGLVSGGNTPSFALNLNPGSGAQATLSGSNTPVSFTSADSGCLRLYAGDTDDHQTFVVPYTYSVIFDPLDAGTAGYISYTGLADAGGCGPYMTDAQRGGLAQGPLQLQVFAPNAQALSFANGQMSYFYSDPNYAWQVSYNGFDINAAKKTWTAPLYQGGSLNYTTAFSVVNASNVAQSVTIKLRDASGNQIGTPQVTPVLAAGCGCNQLNQSAAGGFYANTVTAMFGNLGDQFGSIEFDANANILVLVLRTVNNTLAFVPAK